MQQQQQQGVTSACVPWRQHAVQVHVYPLDHARAKAAIEATHVTKPAEGQQSRRERRLAAYKGKPRRSALAAAAVAAAAN